MVDIQNYLDTIKNAVDGDSVRDAIINCMNTINQDSKYTVQARNISGKVSELPTVIKAPAGIVYKQINLDIQNDDGSGQGEEIVSHDWKVDNNTENGSFTAKDLFGENSKFGTITVDLDFSDTWEDIADNVVISTEDLDDTGTWHAELDKSGCGATRSITFTNVDVAASKGGYIGRGGNAYYPVTFQNSNGEVVYGPVDVISGGTADYQGPMPPDDSPEGSFSGWNPPPSQITRKTVCTPVYGSGDISHDTIPESVTWAQLAAGKAADYNLGSIKTLQLNSGSPMPAKTIYSSVVNPDSGSIPYHIDVDQMTANNTLLPMMLVAKGEGSTGSTWLSTRPLKAIKNSEGHPAYGEDGYPMFAARGYYSADDWNTCYIRQWLDTSFLYSFPKSVRDVIVPCIKHHIGRSTYNANLKADVDFIEKTWTSGRIWIPSNREMYGFLRDFEPTEDRQIETNGIDYATVAGWKPDISATVGGYYRIATRSAGYHGGNAPGMDMGQILLDHNFDLHEMSVARPTDTFPQGSSDSSFYYIGFCL